MTQYVKNRLKNHLLRKMGKDACILVRGCMPLVDNILTQRLQLLQKRLFDFGVFAQLPSAWLLTGRLQRYGSESIER